MDKGLFLINFISDSGSLIIRGKFQGSFGNTVAKVIFVIFVFCLPVRYINDKKKKKQRMPF